MESEQAKFSILMFPWLAHGHIFPFLELAKRLSKRNFTVYLCSAPINLDSIKTNLAKDRSIDDDSIKLIELEFESPQLPSEFHTTKNIPSHLSHLIPILIQDFQKSSSSFVGIVNSLNPDLLILDYFQPWAFKYALSRGIPAVCFLVICATSFAFHHHEHTHGTSSPSPFKGIYLLDHERVDYGASMGAFIKDADLDVFAFGTFNLSSDIILFNSSKGLEGKYIDYLTVQCEKPVVPTGPLIVRSNEGENSEIMKWLSGKDRFSTVYVSFGSEYFLSMEEVAEVAKGLELCKANFVWVLRFPLGENAMSVENALPRGFTERAKERGLVVTWAPQTSVLDHESTGGFVSHCGWNSVMESAYFGVPVIAMPMRIEQPLSGRMLVELCLFSSTIMPMVTEAGCCVEVRRSENEGYKGEYIAEAINKLVLEESGEGLWERANKLSEKMRMDEEKEMDVVTEELWELCLKKNKKMMIKQATMYFFCYEVC
uniref:Glycosyltransferase n=1 Tax=Picrorhiza kurrooa TaxID=195120 RepID=L7QGZ9_9LAMI|nr:UDP-glucosyltransferase isoform 2 [Picrorhiza kurrooa]